MRKKINEADTLLGLLDGQRLCALMSDDKLGKIWAVSDIPNMLNIMQRSTKPIHFVISKWDVVAEQYSFEEIRNRLLKIDEFKNIVKLRNQAGTPVRLIPVSSVGRGFAELQPDGSMAKTGMMPKPFQVEMPLACILPDMIKKTLEEIITKKKEEIIQPVEVKPNLSFWDKLGQFIGGGLKASVGIIQQFLPKKYQFAEDILENLIDFIDVLEQPAKPGGATKKSKT